MNTSLQGRRSWQSAVIARPQAVAIHGFMDCRVPATPRSDGLMQTYLSTPRHDPQY
jgi:hypothetical protein